MRRFCSGHFYISWVRVKTSEASRLQAVDETRTFFFFT